MVARPTVLICVIVRSSGYNLSTYLPMADKSPDRSESTHGASPQLSHEIEASGRSVQSHNILKEATPMIWERK